MTCIVSDILSLLQHLRALKSAPEVYRQERCPCCGKSGVWRHGHYHRKCIRHGAEEGLTDPIRILRFICPSCKKTHSVLPECIPPRQWYLWIKQQIVFINLLLGKSLRNVCQSRLISRSTARRWWQRFNTQFSIHADVLRVHVYKLGLHENFSDFWAACLEKITLAKSMLLCHRQGVRVP